METLINYTSRFVINFSNKLEYPTKFNGEKDLEFVETWVV